MMLEFRNPFPVETPLGAALAIYVTPSGTLENDVWCCALKDDGQLLHFKTDQLKIGRNGTFDVRQQLEPARTDEPHFLHEQLSGEGFEGQLMTACGLRAAPYSGLYFVSLPGGGRIIVTTDPTARMCAQCHRVTARPGYVPPSPSYNPLEHARRK